ncbi:MAG: HNH endonuclease [Kineosporiaceae bacterium]
MRAYIGVTDGRWYRYLLRRRPSEVNFWQPSGGRRFRAIEPGAPFLFKTSYRDPLPHRIVGCGFLSGWASLPLSRAWEFFGEENGCESEAELKRSISAYRRRQSPDDEDPEIGCIMLRDVTFLTEEQTFPAPDDWSRNIVQGKTYDVSRGSVLENDLVRLLGASAEQPSAMEPGGVDGDVFGDPRLQQVRLGQRAFKALVQEAYGRRCAITGDRVVPVLEAAHIRPVAASGENRIDNGLLLRSDVHTLFDRGYLGIHPRRRTLMVSPRLRATWGNGDEFYARERAAVPVRSPISRANEPRVEALEWHADTVFKA